MPDHRCPACGGDVPEGSRFCPHCGTRLEDATAVIEPPPDETGPVPVRRETVELHLFGVTPPTAVFALAVAALAVGVLLVVLGALALGLVVLAAGVVLLLVSLGVARRKPDSDLARAGSGAVDDARSRLASTYTALLARSRAARRVSMIRAELLQLEQRRNELLTRLGRAVYARDEAATESLRDELAELDRTAAEREARMTTIVEQACAEVSRAHLEVQRTEMVEVPDTPGESSPTEPARVPEPYPPPDEGTPPQPARTPEPYPPPDEGDPPDPARIPEPGGDSR